MRDRIPFHKLNNTRDMGGLVTADGRKIISGKLIRSGQLNQADEEDIAHLQEIVSVVIDFRSESEMAEKPDPVIEGISYIPLPAIEDVKKGITREESSDRDLIEHALGDAEKARNFMRMLYRELAESPDTAEKYEHFVRILLEDHEKAVLWHCSAGKDRAGFGAVIIGELLGLSKEVLLEDYLCSNRYLEEGIQNMIHQFGLKEMTNEKDAALHALFGADASYFEELYSTIEHKYGSMEQFLREGLHVTAEMQEQLRQKYLTAA